MLYEIKNNFYTAKISTCGAELVSLKSEAGYEYLWQNNKDFWNKHAPLLFPVCGRLKDGKYTYCGTEYKMKGHGFIGEAEFSVKEISSDRILLSFVSNEKTREIYPFDFRVNVEYKLTADKLEFCTDITNLSKEAMPYMFGWHPGFNLPTENVADIEDYSVVFEGCDSLTWNPLQHGCFVRPRGEAYPLTNNRYNLCEDEIYKNDTMIFTGHENRLKLITDKNQYNLEMSWSDNLPILCIWKQPSNEAKFICLEPWSSAPNDGETEENFNERKMLSLSPGNSEKFSYTVKISM